MIIASLRSMKTRTDFDSIFRKEAACTYLNICKSSRVLKSPLVKAVQPARFYFSIRNQARYYVYCGYFAVKVSVF